MKQYKNMPPEICMFVMNSVVSDPRVKREAETIAGKGRRVVVIGISDDMHEECDSSSYLIIKLKKPALLRMIAWVRNKFSIVNSSTEENRGMSGRKSGAILLKIRKLFIKMVFSLAILFSDIINNFFMTLAGLRLKAKVYHSHDLNTLLAGYICSKINRARLVYDFHEAFTEQYAPGTYSKIWQWFYSFLEQMLIRRADGLITVCDSLKKWAGERYAVSGIEVIMNTSKYIEPILYAREGQKKIVLYHGVFLKDRGIEQLIESFGYINNAKLVIRGLGPTETILRNMVKNMKFEDRIEFAPAVEMEKLVKYASEADIGVIPYIATNLNNKFTTPNKLFEYMMAGLAIGGSDLPELRNIIMGNNLGKVFDPTDPKDIARAINEMVSDEALLSEMKNNSLTAARDKYNWEKESQKLITLYERLC